MNSESPNISSHTVAQLRDARLERWHQTGEALQTAENLRSWVNAAGLIQFAPQPQIVAPAPTFVEAVVGTSSSEPTLQQISDARGLLARLVADGAAVPLNLLGAHGAPGDTPDFVASAAVFSYVFTLRGDKAWKQPPATSGPIKVSNLALAAYEAISTKGPLSAYDLTTQLGKEVTEAACTRSLNELWGHLRVIPLIAADGRATTWELTSARFSKQIKAGANAGIPSAVSALVSLYLGQTMAASEDEIESFISLLAPRSRIREVVHTLLNARQLDTLVIEGKTLLHVAGEAPSFAPAEPDLKRAEHEPVAAAAQEDQAGEERPRITKYIPRPRKVGTGYLAKGKPAAGKHSFGRGGSEGFKPRTGARDDRERRPFRKNTGKDSERRFDRPWEEDRPNRPVKRTGESHPRFRPAREGGWQDSARRELRGGPRPQRRDEGRSERRPRPEGEYRGRKGGYPDRGPQRRGEGESFQRPQNRPRVDQDQGKSRREGAEGQSRPQFRRFDAPRREGRPQRPRQADDRVQGRERSDTFDRKPPRREAGYEGRPPRREGEFERRPPRRESGFQGRSPRREGTSDNRPRRDGDLPSRPGKKQGGKRPFGKSKFGGASKRPSGKFANPPGKKKPFEKKPSDRTFKPRRDESA